MAQERPAEEAAEDLATKALIEDALFQEHFADLFNKIGVIVVEGRVLLTGTVPEPSDVTIAGEVVADTPGVQEVLNELVAGEPANIPTIAADTRISLEIRAKMASDPEVRQINYWTTTEKRVVYLIGIAQGDLELARALDIARNVAGVEKVVTHVIMKNDPRRLAERN